MKSLLESAKWNDDLERRALRERDYNFYNDDHNYNCAGGVSVTQTDEINKIVATPKYFYSGFLEMAIFKRVSLKEAIMLCGYIETDNMFKQIVEQQSLIFKEPPEIKLLSGTEKQVDNFEKIKNDSGLIILMREINKLTNALFDIHVVPTVRDDVIDLDIVLPQNCFVEQDEENPTKFKRFFYQVDTLENSIDGKRVDEYYYWDDEGKHKCNILDNGKIDEATIEDIPTIWDGTGIIPVVCFRNYVPVNTYWCPRQNYLVEKNIAIDLRLTALNALEDFNLPQKVRIGMDESREGKTGLSFTEDILRNNNGEAIGDIKYIRPDAPVKDEKDLIDWRKQISAVSAGLSADSLSGKRFNSGYELFLSKSEIIEKNKSERELYRKPMRQLIRYMLTLAKQLNMNFGEAPEFKIDFGELTYTQSLDEKITTRLKKIQEGTWSPVMSLMADNPELTEEDAIKEIKRIKSQNDMIKPENPFNTEQVEDENDN